MLSEPELKRRQPCQGVEPATGYERVPVYHRYRCVDRPAVRAGSSVTGDGETARWFAVSTGEVQREQARTAFRIDPGSRAGRIVGGDFALQSTRSSLLRSLKDQAGTVAGSGGSVRLRKALVITQVSFSLLLLAATGLFVQSLRNRRASGPGFPAENLIGFSLDPSLNGYSLERRKLFYQELTRNLNAAPGVQSAVLASVRILEGVEWDYSVTVEGYESKPEEDMNPYFNSVSPGYFLTLGIPLLAGRDFTLQDTGTNPYPFGSTALEVSRVIIVNERFARYYFGDRNPLGRHLGHGRDPGTKTDMQIIGVFKDIRYTSLRDEIPRQVFVPYLTDPSLAG